MAFAAKTTKQSDVRAIFFGTPALAIPSLEALAGIAEVVLVVCQPDRPQGRGLTLTPPPIKVRALDLGLRVLQPTKVRTREFADELVACAADVALVLAYGRILPPAVLRAPRLGCLNLHASLLPRLRGAAPIQWAIVRGETETGISLMQMDEGLDTGPVYDQRTLRIEANETAGELGERLGRLAASVVTDDVPRVLAGALASMPQDDAQATHAPPLTKGDGRIDWTKPAKAVHDHVRGMHPWPGAFTQAGGKTVKVLATKAAGPYRTSEPPGTVVCADPSGILVSCGEGVIEIVRAQLEGRRALSSRELVAGRAFSTGMKLGERAP